MPNKTPSSLACAEFEAAYRTIRHDERGKADSLGFLSEHLKDGSTIDPEALQGMSLLVTGALEETIWVVPRPKRDRLLKSILALGIKPDVRMGNHQQMPLMRLAVQKSVVSVIVPLHEAGFRLSVGRSSDDRQRDRRNIASSIGSGHWPLPELIEPGLSKDPASMGSILEGIMWMLDRNPDKKHIHNAIKKLERAERFMDGHNMGPALTRELKEFIIGGMWRGILANAPSESEPLFAKLMSMGMEVGPGLKAIEDAEDREDISAFFARAQQLNMDANTAQAPQRSKPGMRL